MTGSNGQLCEAQNCQFPIVEPVDWPGPGMLSEAHSLAVWALDARKACASRSSSLHYSHELIQMQTFGVKN